MADSDIFSSKNLILASLFITGFATHARLIISSLLLIEIGATFNVPVGIAGQIVTAASVLSIVSALFMGVLTLRFNSKPLLQAGVIVFIVCGLGCYLAPSFSSMLVSYSLAGIAGAMVFPMLGTIIGETLPPEERSKALGLVSAGQPVSFVFGSSVVAYIASSQGWRMAFLYYMIPVVTLSFLVVSIGIPKQSLLRENRSGSGRLVGYKGVLSSRSALSCLLGALLFQASMFTAWTYVVSFLREDYLIPQSWATALLSVMALCSALGSITVERIVTRFGKKGATTLLAFVLGLTVVIAYNPFSLWVSLFFVFLWAYVAAAGYVSGDTLTLDQVPEYRGTLMSLNVVARNLGATLGGLLGGSLLLFTNYNFFGVVMGMIGVASAVVYRLFTQE